MSDFAACRNLLEPPAYTALFERFLPEGFDLVQNGGGIPLFRLNFDLLTTLDRRPRARLRALPGFRYWSGWFRKNTCFTGTSITEYSPLPRALPPRALLDILVDEVKAGQRLTIIKDLPNASPFLSPPDNEYADALVGEAVGRGFFTLEGQALAYLAIDFSSADEYLARLSAGRRKDIRRKLKKREQLDIETVPLGDARFSDPRLLKTLYAMYQQVYSQSEIHFDRLTAAFFAALLQEGKGWGVVFFYRRREKYRRGGEEELVGYNICLIEGKRLIDKYIGFNYPLARELNLYFISWLVNLEYALTHGLDTYIAGWTDPEVKRSLGASFTFTRHLVRIQNPLLRQLLFPLRRLFEADARALS